MGRLKSHIIVVLLILIFKIVISTDTKKSGDTKTIRNEDEGFCEISTEDSSKLCVDTVNRRYFLYDVNPGEGFNLRRDIYIRIAPLIYSLNRDNEANSQWILVLPPWTRLPHWKNTHYSEIFEWSTFFNLDEIKAYIPVVEFEQFYMDYGKGNALDVYYQLQHLPFPENGEEWVDKIEDGVQCNELLLPERSKNGDYILNIWNHRLKIKKASCMGLQGQASTLHNFIKDKDYKAIMFSNAEVILWDEFGGRDWWRARKSLKFSNRLIQLAKQFQAKLLLTNESYMAIHMRRGDFFTGREEKSVEMSQVAEIINKKRYKSVFVATDALDEEWNELISNIEEDKVIQKIHCAKGNLSDGECAIIDQLLCSWADFFIGTEGSTFTQRIFEEREILEKTPETTYNNLCSNPNNCNRATRWPIVL